MSVLEIVELIILIITTLGLVVTLITAILKGKLKEFIIEKMEEAETQELTSASKLEFVISAVKEKYKILTIILNVKTFIEKVIEVTKNINYKGK